MSAMVLSGGTATPGLSGKEVVLRVSGAHQAIEADQPGIIRGKVSLVGMISERRHVEVKKDMELCGKELISEELILSEGGGVMNAVVSIEGIKTEKVSQQGVVLDNKACAFVPHVLAITNGSTLEIRTSDPVIHTAHLYLGDRTLFNLALPPTRRGTKIERKLEESGLIKVLCDVHSWMKAYILVVDHPYFAVTDGKGLFEIRDVPPGSYQIKVWHELLGVQLKEASVSEGKDTLVEFTFEEKKGKIFQ